MNHRPGGSSHQAKNRGLIPQKLRHFFSTFPESYDIPALPDWLLRRPMGSVWCVPKSPQHNNPSGGDHHRQKGRRNRIEPESNAQFLPKRKPCNSKRANRVANLTYKNTWSSFLKTSQSDQVKFLPDKSIAPPPFPNGAGASASSARPNVRFDKHRRSWDDSSLVLQRQLSAETSSSLSVKPNSSSPVRRRPSSMKTDSRKYSKLESKALREAWLNENVFPQFSLQQYLRTSTAAAAVSDNPARGGSAHKQSKTTYTLHEIISSCPPMPPYRSTCGHRRGSVEANVSSGTSNDTFLTPGSMDMSGTSTLPTTSGSIQVNATSSPSSSFDSMQPGYSTRPTVPSPPERDYHQQQRCVADDSLLETTTSQSVEVQVSSTITSSTSMQPHLSSSSGGYPSLFVNDISAATVARDVLKKERAISSANSRKSCLKERNSSNNRFSRRPPSSSFKDPTRFEWTKRYLYT